MSSTQEEREYYGSVKGMPQDLLKERLVKALADAQELQSEMGRRSNFTVAEKLADRLHRLLHFGIDCDYYYSDWPQADTSCRAQFRYLAEQMIETAGFPVAEKVAGMLEAMRFGRQG